MSTHTPGPWRLEVGRSEEEAAKTRFESWGIVHRPRNRVIETNLADARLIAAAPDLLDIARRVAAHFADTDSPLGLAAAAAIAKAEGQ